jgi:metallophosphoesterase (TIGR00282 family)
MLKILFIGDVVGKIGRKTIKKILPKLKRELKPDIIIANAENAAHGAGVNIDSLKELMEAGVDYFTLGDHAFDKEKQFKEIKDANFPIIRPANFPSGAPGAGYGIIAAGKYNVLIINLIGRVFMAMDYDCPFRKLDEILASLANRNYSAIIIDIHAEATSEKIALSHYAKNRVSAVLGTHTHVMTADASINKDGQAFISDVGMVGAADECLGIGKEGIIRTFLNQIKETHIIPEKGRAIFNSALITIDPKTKKAKNIKPITEYININ